MQYKVFKDGNRIICVFDNTEVSVEQIAAILGNVPQATEKITNVAMPPRMAVSQSSNIQNRQNDIPKINPEKLLQEQGFAGFCSIYTYYTQFRSQLAIDVKQNLSNIIKKYSDFLKNRNVEEMSDQELKFILKQGSTTIFPNSMKQCLQQSGYASLEDFLESGRNNLEDAYLACVGN